MNAREITTALNGSWHGNYGLVPGPDHSQRDRSLKVWDSNGGVMVHSFAGEDWRACRDWLKRHGLLPDDREGVPQRRRAPKRPANLCPRASHDDARRTECALEIWRASVPACGTTAETYLTLRGITVAAPPSIRFARALKYTPSGVLLPAMVAAVQAPDRHVTAVHRTFLDPRGHRKAQVSSPKMALGPLGSGAVRLAAAGETLGISEGIETGLSAMQFFGVPVWAALGSRMHHVALPDEVHHVIIFADNGDAGRETAEKAAGAFTGQGRIATLQFPPEEFGDWNDYAGAA